MTHSPKQRFLQEDRLAKQFLDVVDSEAFQRATELAMLALVAEVPAMAKVPVPIDDPFFLRVKMTSAVAATSACIEQFAVVII